VLKVAENHYFSTVNHDTTLKFPLSPENVTLIKGLASPAPVGTKTSEVVNLDVRTTFQLLPSEFTIANPEEYAATLETILQQVEVQLGFPPGYSFEAKLYKMLMYEPGCFFRKHRDNERLPGMFGTLVIQLPSVYKGAALQVWSPGPGGTESCCLLPPHGMDQKLRWAAFYADCFHEITELESGTRTALVYSLTAVTTQFSKPHLGMHSNPTPFRLHAGLVDALAASMDKFANETNDDYPDTTKETTESHWVTIKDGEGKDVHRSQRKQVTKTVEHVKPVKLSLVLEHLYTPKALQEAGVSALKGRDASIGALLLAAQHKSATSGHVPSLQHLAACAVVESDPDNYKQLPADHPLHAVLDEQLQVPRLCDSQPRFDAFLTLAVFWETGEMSPAEPFYTFGPLYPLNGQAAVMPFDLGQGVLADLHEHSCLVETGGGPDGPGSPDRDDDGYPIPCSDSDDDGYRYDPGRGKHGFVVRLEEMLFGTEESKAVRTAALIQSDYAGGLDELAQEESGVECKFALNYCLHRPSLT
jgi:hypothetical protein